MFRLPFLALVLAAQVAQAEPCDQSKNPHSFACADSTFRGQIFPIAWMNGDILVGNWKLLTYSPIDGVAGPEFKILVNPQNPRVPEGVVNRSDNSPVGVFDWTPHRLRINNFGRKGHSINEIQGRTFFPDPHSVEAHFSDDKIAQGVQCRMFLRNNNDHLLCRWFTLSGGKATFRGYLGFLRGN